MSPANLIAASAALAGGSLPAVELAGWFQIDTPLGKYSPDWAIVNVHTQTFYLVHETKGTRDFLGLRTSEADKVYCGMWHLPWIQVAQASHTD